MFIFISIYSRCFQALLLAALLPLLQCVSPDTTVSRPEILATTTMIAGMIDAVAPASFSVTQLIPPGACPGHYDLKPADALVVARATAVIRHDFQAYLDAKMRQQNPGLTIHTIASDGALTIPSRYRGALTKLREVLTQQFPSSSAVTAAAFPVCLDRLAQLESAIVSEAQAADLPGVVAVASQRQADFLQWLGLRVCGTFPETADALSVAELQHLLLTARSAGAQVVVENLQSDSQRLSKTLGNELHLPVCTLSNFPSAVPGTTTYEALLHSNIRALVKTCGRRQ